ncbi:hypothetical protein KAFR_0I00370 [Kazachstania africana CBS 2517]|uniref:Spore membrane assembly protein 2 n=1 Tax=Kazachstania africana (strain ATCC 22294 / BCRC 22015 / CBS 2517 / CECT 1963 / NBRC 1671 / NRRL Y-8276) TaxID=1071382 RepID=H2AZL8_KAZAF|nr:hypothetical protein KAFR_0I00370 [Kazachstania africana CBS 2517]CCF59818.1 hypothetical protein KAFR_0I00370 [Kazachstania africana CBS 2517]
MFFLFKKLLVWSVLLSLTLTQLLLYLPNLTCTSTSTLPVCTPQFNFAIVGSSTTAKEFIGSIRQFLKLLSYLTIDMGWSNELTDSSIYDDANLIDTFSADNVYNVNYFGYCKRNATKTIYCMGSGDAGMDILGVLVRDIGSQLSKLSTVHENNTVLLSNSMVFTYHLALKSLRAFFKKNQAKDNFLSSLLIGDVGNDGKSGYVPKSYDKGVEFAYSLMKFNQIYFYFQTFEMSMSCLYVILIFIFGTTIFLNLKIKLLTIPLKLVTLVLLLASTVTFSVTGLYLVALKAMEPPDTSQQVAEPDFKWGLLEISVGSGFIIGFVRYFIQFFMCIITFICVRHYKTSSKEDKKSLQKENPNYMVESPIKSVPNYRYKGPSLSV